MSAYEYSRDVPSAFSIRNEPLDVDKVNYIMEKHFKPTNDFRGTTEAMTWERIKKLPKDTKSVDVLYEMKASGRFFAKGVAHHKVPRIARFPSIPKGSHDIDMENSKFRILNSLIKYDKSKTSISHKYLNNYVEKRKKWLDLVPVVFPTLKMSPKQFFVILYNAGFETIPQSTHPKRQEFVAMLQEANAIYAHIASKLQTYDLDHYESLLEKAKETYGAAFDALTADKINTYICDILLKQSESEIIYNSIRYLQSKGLQPFGYSFDGFLLPPHENIDELLDELNKWLFDESPFDVKFINKSYQDDMKYDDIQVPVMEEQPESLATEDESLTEEQKIATINYKKDYDELIRECMKNSKVQAVPFANIIIKANRTDMILHKRDKKDKTLYIYQESTGIWKPELDGAMIRRYILKLQESMTKTAFQKIEYPSEEQSQQDELNRKNLLKNATQLSNISIQNAIITWIMDDPLGDITKTKDEIIWNNQPMLFAFRNGVFDLKTGKFRAAMREEFMSLTTSHNYIPFDQIPEQKIKEINEIFETIFSNEEERNFCIRQSALGLCGLPKQNFIVSIGDGGNGKGILINIRRQVLDMYHHTMSIEWFMKSRHGVAASAADSELAQLQGKRYVDVDEPEQEKKGISLRVAKLKSLTGGNAIVARDLFESSKKFIATALINFSTNFPVNLPTNDGGVQRRFINTVFRNKFVDDPEKFDLSTCIYSTKALQKKDGIDQLDKYHIMAVFFLFVNSLDWNLVQTNIERALNIPLSFKQATSQYMESMDGFPQFFERFIQPTNDENDRLYISDIHKKWLENKTGSTSYTPNSIKEFIIKKGIHVFKSKNILSIKGYKILQEQGVQEEEDHNYAIAPVQYLIEDDE